MARNGKRKLIDATGLTPAQEKLVFHIVILGNVAAAARACDIAERTARRWFDLPMVQAHYLKIREEAFRTGQLLLEQSFLNAAHLCLNVMNNESIKAETRLKAAALILNHGQVAHAQLLCAQTVSVEEVESA